MSKYINLGFNLEDIPDPNEIPPGLYLATISAVEQAVSKNGNPMLVVDFVIDSEEGVNTDGDYIEVKGKKMRDRITLTENAIFRYRDLCRALDVPMVAETDDEGNDLIDIDSLMEKQVGIVTESTKEMENGKATGRTFYNIKTFAPTTAVL